jgi:hypothetical protein
MLSTVMSVTSFSVVLAEAFAAVGLSTVVPAAVVTAARLAAQLADDAPADDPKRKRLNGIIEGLPEGNMAGKTADLMKAVAKSLPTLDILLPKTAKIHAEFTYTGTDSLSVSGGVSVPLQVVSVNVGFSELYTTTSSNKITLDVDFVSVNVPIAG